MTDRELDAADIAREDARYMAEGPLGEDTVEEAPEPALLDLLRSLPRPTSGGDPDVEGAMREVRR